MTVPGSRAPVLPPPPPAVLQPHATRTGRLTLALAVLSVGIGAAALIVAISGAGGRVTAAPAAPTYTAAQITAAKARACKSAKRAIADLRTTTHRAAPNSMDDAVGWANVANARAARLSAAVYLPTQIDPATPADLKNAATEFATAAGDSLALSLSGTNSDQYTKDTAALNASAKEIERLCQ